MTVAQIRKNTFRGNKDKYPFYVVVLEKRDGYLFYNGGDGDFFVTIDEAVAYAKANAASFESEVEND